MEYSECRDFIFPRAYGGRLDSEPTNQIETHALRHPIIVSDMTYNPVLALWLWLRPGNCQGHTNQRCHDTCANNRHKTIDRSTYVDNVDRSNHHRTYDEQKGFHLSPRFFLAKAT